MNHLTFSYPLPEGSLVEGFDADEVQSVGAFCTPDEEDGYAVSYYLMGKGVGLLPYAGFGGSTLPCRAVNSVETVEVSARSRIELDLLHHAFGTLERRYGRPIFEYACPPDILGGRADVALRVRCYWPGPGVYRVELWLVVSGGGADLYLVGARLMLGGGVPLDVLYARVQKMADALLPQGFDEMVDMLVLRGREGA